MDINNTIVQKVKNFFGDSADASSSNNASLTNEDISIFTDKSNNQGNSIQEDIVNEEKTQEQETKKETSSLLSAIANTVKSIADKISDAAKTSHNKTNKSTGFLSILSNLFKNSLQSTISYAKKKVTNILKPANTISTVSQKTQNNIKTKNLTAKNININNNKSSNSAKLFNSVKNAIKNTFSKFNKNTAKTSNITAAETKKRKIGFKKTNAKYESSNLTESNIGNLKGTQQNLEENIQNVSNALQSVNSGSNEIIKRANNSYEESKNDYFAALDASENETISNINTNIKGFNEGISLQEDNLSKINDNMSDITSFLGNQKSVIEGMTLAIASYDDQIADLREYMHYDADDETVRAAKKALLETQKLKSKLLKEKESAISDKNSAKIQISSLKKQKQNNLETINEYKKAKQESTAELAHVKKETLESKNEAIYQTESIIKETKSEIKNELKNEINASSQNLKQIEGDIADFQQNKLFDAISGPDGKILISENEDSQQDAAIKSLESNKEDNDEAYKKIQSKEDDFSKSEGTLYASSFKKALSFGNSQMTQKAEGDQKVSLNLNVLNLSDNEVKFDESMLVGIQDKISLIDEEFQSLIKEEDKLNNVDYAALDKNELSELERNKEEIKARILLLQKEQEDYMAQQAVLESKIQSGKRERENCENSFNEAVEDFQKTYLEALDEIYNPIEQHE